MYIVFKETNVICAAPMSLLQLFNSYALFSFFFLLWCDHPITRFFWVVGSNWRISFTGLLCGRRHQVRQACGLISCSGSAFGHRPTGYDGNHFRPTKPPNRSTLFRRRLFSIQLIWTCTSHTRLKSRQFIILTVQPRAMTVWLTLWPESNGHILFIPASQVRRLVTDHRSCWAKFAGDILKTKIYKNPQRHPHEENW